MFPIVHEAYSRQQILAICCSRLVYRGKLCFARSRGPQRTEITPAHPVPLVLAHEIAEMPHTGQLRWTGLASTIAPRCRVIPCIHSLTSFFFFFHIKTYVLKCLLLTFAFCWNPDHQPVYDHRSVGFYWTKQKAVQLIAQKGKKTQAWKESSGSAGDCYTRIEALLFLRWLADKHTHFVTCFISKGDLFVLQ